MEQNKEVVYDHILIRFGELSTKGKNKKDFIKKLLHNIKNALRDYTELEYQKTHDRLYILLHGTPEKEVCAILQHVFGIRSFSLAIRTASDIDEICAVALMVAKQSEHKTFKVDARRSWKQFPFISDTINRRVATEILKNTDLKVNVREPELRLTIEVHEQDTYIMTDRILGAGGYPVGVGGKALVMLSGGIDSPVAAYLTMKRGVAVECIHYASPPYTSQRAQEKVIELARQVAKYQGHVRVHVVPFTELQMAIYQNCDESYAITIMRRMMYRIAARLLENINALAIVNGESIGQVASQTLESMQSINDVTNKVVIRPVCTMDKLEIIEIAKRIGTYETSILPFEDCCTIFTPKNPVTKPTVHKARNMEERFDFEKYIEQCIKDIQIIDVYPERKKLDEDDLF